MSNPTYTILLNSGITLESALNHMLENIWTESKFKRKNKKAIKKIIYLIGNKKITLITEKDINKIKLSLKKSQNKLIKKHLKLLKITLETLRNKEKIFFYQMPNF